MRPRLIAALLPIADPAFAQATSTTNTHDQTDTNRTPNAPAQAAKKGGAQIDDPSLANKAGLKKRKLGRQFRRMV